MWHKRLYLFSSEKKKDSEPNFKKPLGEKRIRKEMIPCMKGNFTKIHVKGESCNTDNQKHNSQLLIYVSTKETINTRVNQKEGMTGKIIKAEIYNRPGEALVVS